MKRFFFRIAACALMSLAAACMSAGGGKPSVSPLGATVLASGRQCGAAPEGWRATWLGSSEAFRDFLTRCRSDRIGGASKDLPDVDFQRFGVVAVEMGQRPTAGYGFAPGTVAAEASGERTTLRLEYYQPAPDAMAAQVITAPWILIQLPLDSPRDIVVVDQDGVRLAEVRRL